MKDKQTDEATIRNLQDAGCDDEVIRKYLDCMQRQDEKGGLRVLSEHRRTLLGNIHLGERKVDCLDYLVYQLEKRAKEREHGKPQ